MYKKKTVLAVITARGGSKGVPRKNVRKLGSKPLLHYSLEACFKSKYITKVVVSSDDDEILNVAKKIGGKEILLKRPKELALDNSPSILALQHAVLDTESKMGCQFDHIILIQPTTPFILSTDIDKCIKLIVETKCDSVVSVHEMNDHHPIKAKKIVDGILVPYVEGMEENSFRRQDLPPVYKRNGGIYINKRYIVMEKNSCHGTIGVCRPYIMSKEQSVDINSIIDFYTAEAVLKHRGKIRKKK